MASISKGYTFGATETVTASKLHDLVDLATVTSIVNADVDASANIDSTKLDLASAGYLTSGQSTATITGVWTFEGNTTFAGTTIADLGEVTTADINGGTIDGVTIGATSAPTVTNLGSVATVDINGGTLDGVQIGGTTATGELIVNNADDAADGLGSQGTSGQFLKSQGAGSNPTWASVSGYSLVVRHATTENESHTVSNGNWQDFIGHSSALVVDAYLEFYKVGQSTLRIRYSAQNTTGGATYRWMVNDSTSYVSTTRNPGAWTDYDDTIDISGLADNAWYTIKLQALRNTSGSSVMEAKEITVVVY